MEKESAAYITSRDTLDGAYPGLLLGINSRRIGMEAKIFFTFMGINIIRKGHAKKAKFYPPGFMGAIPGMAAFASWMMKNMIKKSNTPAIDELLEIAVLEGVEMIACKMTADMMQLDGSAFIENVSIQTAENFLKYARTCKVQLFT
jgi:peroxiredoxin family protein